MKKSTNFERKLVLNLFNYSKSIVMFAPSSVMLLTVIVHPHSLLSYHFPLANVDPTLNKSLLFP